MPPETMSARLLTFQVAINAAIFTDAQHYAFLADQSLFQRLANAGGMLGSLGMLMALWRVRLEASRR